MNTVFCSFFFFRLQKLCRTSPNIWHNNMQAFLSRLFLSVKTSVFYCLSFIYICLYYRYFSFIISLYFTCHGHCPPFLFSRPFRSIFNLFTAIHIFSENIQHYAYCIHSVNHSTCFSIVRINSASLLNVKKTIQVIIFVL